MKKKALTAGELIMAIAILTVIAFIVVPNISANLVDKDRTSKAKKGYATLASALTMVKSWGGDYILDVRKDTRAEIEEWFDEFLKPNLQIRKACYDEAGCWNKENNKNMNETNVYNNRKGVGIGYNIVTAILNDGSYINVDIQSNEAVWRYLGVDLHTDFGLVIFYDINGDAKPNTVGKDIFVSVFTEDGLVPAFRDLHASKVIADCSKNGTGFSCLRVYLKKS